MKHVLFDLDGTLTDPKEGIVACIRYALQKLEIEIEETVRLESYIGPPLFDTFRALCDSDALANEGVAYYRERFTDTGLYENRVFDGIPQCLERLGQEVGSIHVATSKPTVYSKRIIEHFGLDDYFGTVYGSELDGSLSDKTELLAHIVTMEGLSPEDVVMIGDRKFDIAGAKNNGMQSVGVLWGYGDEQELETAGADALCAHPDELAAQVLAL